MFNVLLYKIFYLDFCFCFQFFSGFGKLYKIIETHSKYYFTDPEHMKMLNVILLTRKHTKILNVILLTRKHTKILNVILLTQKHMKILNVILLTQHFGLSEVHLQDLHQTCNYSNRFLIVPITTTINKNK